MTPMQWIQLSLLTVKILNWVITKVDQTQWKTSGYNKAMQEQLALCNEHLASADKAIDEAKKATPEERRKELGDPT